MGQLYFPQVIYFLKYEYLSAEVIYLLFSLSYLSWFRPALAGGILLVVGPLCQVSPVGKWSGSIDPGTHCQCSRIQPALGPSFPLGLGPLEPTKTQPRSMSTKKISLIGEGFPTLHVVLLTTNF